METRALSDWSAFEAELEKVSVQLASYRVGKYDHVSRPLYRGQSHASWPLHTTLERYVKNPVRFEDYKRYLSAAKPAIESFTEKNFRFHYRNPTVEGTTTSVLGLVEGQYELMVYLRHHGFPSPLLDWSRSPYVALFFAYQNAKEDEPVAVYVYVKDIGHGKGGLVGAPEIFVLGHYVSSHNRHFIQQSEYSACFKCVDDVWQFCPHEEALHDIEQDQDLLIKLTLPGAEKEAILAKLDSMNINAFSLFGSEEGLMSMLAFREKDIITRGNL